MHSVSRLVFWNGQWIKSWAVLFLGIIFCLLLGCGAFAQKSVDTKIRIINNSKFSLSQVSLFSMRFEDLQSGDTSVYKVLKYNSLMHDPLIYCISDSINYGRYVKIPSTEAKQYVYVVDSLADRMIYVNSFEDQ
ncbi:MULTISPECIES: hypothetical protein [Flavobacteriaceae]|uniref:hypothetical protein n=1 Tax=Flavobacteriaceae TaxID=49546 RepID=UPI0014918880|nr:MULTISPECIES: hypothetical protein [Allomuricauda]MDC6366874.1 hypothetical protein [Muricauda sp. AC10]